MAAPTLEIPDTSKERAIDKEWAIATLPSPWTTRLSVPDDFCNLIDPELPPLALTPSTIFLLALVCKLIPDDDSTYVLFPEPRYILFAWV